MDSLTLDQLRVFLTVVEAGSFSAAARRLRRAQSAVSYAVANLEKLLDLSLFDRSGQRPTLTEAGKNLLADAREIMVHTDQLRARARLMSSGTESRVSLAVDVMFPLEELVGALRDFREAFPGVTLLFHSEALGGVARLVKEGTCQFGISGPLHEFPAELERRALTSVPVIPVAALSHPLAHYSGPIPVAELREQIQIVLTDRSHLTEGLDVGVLSTRTWRIADLGAKHAFIRAGFGWGNMPEHLVAHDLTTRKLVHLQAAEWSDALTVPLYVINRVSDPPGPAGRWLVERIERACKALAATGASDERATATAVSAPRQTIAFAKEGVLLSAGATSLRR